MHLESCQVYGCLLFTVGRQEVVHRDDPLVAVEVLLAQQVVGPCGDFTPGMTHRE